MLLSGYFKILFNTLIIICGLFFFSTCPSCSCNSKVYQDKLIEGRTPSNNPSPSNNPATPSGRKDIKNTGLPNISNTCFMNASLQLLSTLPNLTIDETALDTENKELYQLWKKIQDKLTLKEAGPITSEEATKFRDKFYKENTIFKSKKKGDQEDAHEFLTSLLSQLSVDHFIETKDIYQNDTGDSYNSNAGTLEYFLSCSIINDVNNQKFTNLGDCIESFFKNEQLSSDNEIPLNGKKYNQKKTFIENLPEILLIHLKRSQCNKTTGSIKLNNEVQFPTDNLELKAINNKAGSYNLKAIIYHHGNTLNSGHYTASIRHENKWYNKDDSSVNEISTPAIKDAYKAAYILLYEKNPD